MSSYENIAPKNKRRNNNSRLSLLYIFPFKLYVRVHFNKYECIIELPTYRKPIIDNGTKNKFNIFTEVHLGQDSFTSYSKNDHFFLFFVNYGNYSEERLVTFLPVYVSVIPEYSGGVSRKTSSWWSTLAKILTTLPKCSFEITRGSSQSIKLNKNLSSMTSNRSERFLRDHCSRMFATLMSFLRWKENIRS